MSTKETLRSVLSVAASASLAGGMLLIAAESAEAQQAAPASAPTPEPGNPSAIQLPTLKVEAPRGQSTNELQSHIGLERLPDKIQDIPQTITVIPQVVIEQQQATTVDQVLQYVPGITVASGEGYGGLTGDQFRIRGFDASGDIYVDGLRDFGSYIRDDFAIENVIVLKGPSSESFGNGTTGGIIELDSKKAHLGDTNSVIGSAGTGPYGRTVVDLNKQVGNTTALRIVGMYTNQNVIDRDHVYSDRWGVLASAGFGLGTGQQVFVNYFHQSSHDRPDMGVPIVGNGTVVGEPVTEYGVPRSNFFGRASDKDSITADVGTILYKGQFGDWLTLSNDTRFGYYTRELKMTPVMCSPGFPPFTPSSTCPQDVLAGNLNTHYIIWPVGGTKQTSYGGENVTTAVMRFKTLGFRHELIAASMDIPSMLRWVSTYLQDRNPSGRC